MLLGRLAERVRIDGLLEAARSGRGGALVVRGEAGVGKTVLLEYAVERAGHMRVLRAIGAESEATLPFSGLHELVRPLLGLLDEVPGPQARALRGALALDDVPVLDRFSAYAATLSLLLAETERQPVLCVVDDAHWLDGPSAEALLFAARRLEGESMALLFAARDPEVRAFSSSGLPEARLGGLEPADARELLAATFPGGMAESVAERLVRVTGGNPLALLEIPTALDQAHRSGLEPLDEPLPVGQRVERAFLSRASTLSTRARRALLLAAASGPHETDDLWAALEAEGIDPEILGEAAEAGVIVVGAGIRFCHPLARSAIYQAVPPSQRRAAHRTLAKVSDAPDRRAWHRAAASIGPDEDVAAALEQVAEAARRRGGVSAEALALERAARLTPGDESRARRLLRAGVAAESAGWLELAERLLAEAASRSSDPVLRSQAVAKRSYLLFDRGELASAYDLAVGEAAALEGTEPEMAAALLAGSGAVHVLHHRLDVVAARSMAERAERLAGQRARESLDLCHWLAWTGALSGHVAEALDIARSCVDRVDLATVLAVDIGGCFLYLEDYPLAHDLLEGSVLHNRDVGALEILAYGLDLLALLQFRTGHVASAYVNCLESLQLTEPLGNDVALAASLGWLGLMEATLGRHEDCLSHARRALEIAEAREDRWNVVRARSALGLDALGRGDAQSAVQWLEPASRMLEDGGLRHPNFFRVDADLIEAEVRLGQRDEAAAQLARLEEQARGTGSPWANVVAARSRAVLAADADVEDLFLPVLDLHQHDPSDFELARTQLLFGERLRRRGRRRQAREQLHEAVQIFERLGSRPWVDRVRAELRATGETLKRRGSNVQEQLTPQELQIALAVAEGKTNREVGAQLFISPKTVEFHLSRVYRKLDVRSRTELAGLLARVDIGIESPVEAV